MAEWRDKHGRYHPLTSTTDPREVEGLRLSDEEKCALREAVERANTPAWARDTKGNA